ncbi:MAG: ligase-associated DNA damage response endonuclease PdeM [Verrucomicrobiota bacterium]
MAEDAIEFPLAGEQMLALAERALLWPRTRTLFVADVHFGKDATFREHLRWVPPGTTTDDLARLRGLLFRYAVDRLVILGDAFHSESAQEDQTFHELRTWRASLDATVILIEGNHDRRAKAIANELNFEQPEPDFSLPPFDLRHRPTTASSKRYVLCGHLHPVVTARGLARQRLQLRCFWASSFQCVLPAFGGFTGGYPIRPAPDDRVILIADGKVLAAARPSANK